MLRIDQPDRANMYYVLGVAQAEALRGAVRRQRRDTNTPGTVEHAGCQSWTEPGDSEGCDAALRRFLGGLVGAEKVDEALGHKLDPFDKRDILVMATWRKHTKLVELQRSKAVRWSVLTHDSDAASRWDDDLRSEMSRLLEITGLKPSRTKFVYKYPPSVQQKGAVECGYIGFINVIQRLTGETLADEHWPCCVDVICAFFDLWNFSRQKTSTRFARDILLVSC